MIFNIVIAAHVAGLLHMARGSGLSKHGGVYNLIAKAPTVVAMGCLMWLLTGSWEHSLSYFANFYLVLLMGTGFLMIAFREHDGGADIINERDEFPPIDNLVDLIVPEVITNADARRWSVWFGTFVGLCAYPNFILTSYLADWSIVPLLFGVPVLGYGLFAGAMRYIKNTNVWAIVEYGWAVNYLLCSALAWHYG